MLKNKSKIRKIFKQINIIVSKKGKSQGKGVFRQVSPNEKNAKISQRSIQ
jgi:hypothetical protein